MNTDGILTALEVMEREDFWKPLPDIDFEYELSKCKTVFEQQKVFKKYYTLLNDRIIDAAKKGKWFKPYLIDFTRYFTPIEREAWNAIRSSRVILYPQYPVLNYFLDFANPHLKIGLEMDGKEFHNPEKDFIRDTNLYKEGWKIFRVTGSEAVKVIHEIPRDDYEVVMKRNLVLHGTIEGVIDALFQVYFDNKQPTNLHYYAACVSSLNNHRLAEFDI